MQRTGAWLAALLIAGIASPLAAQMDPRNDESVVLQPGDAVQIAVWRQPELSGEFTLSADGTIDHPLYRTIGVVGVPLTTARERVHTYLLGWEAEPQFLMKPLFRVAVGGEVQAPSLYTFPPEMTIAQAVAAAGGVTDRGRLERVRVLRADGTELRVDLTAGDSRLARHTVRSGDQIFVEQTRLAAFRDYVAPAGTFAMAAVTLVSILLR